MPKPLQWLSLVALIIAATTTLFLAVTLTPAASQPPSVEAEVFTKQLDFILKTNSAFLGFLGIIGALLTWFFKNNLEDAKQVAAKMVREELDAHIRDLVKTEFRYWELSAQTERVVGQTLVDYYLPNGTAEPRECALLKHRGFRQVLFCTRLDDIRRSVGDVVILDCQNWQIDANQRLIDLKPDDREAPIRQQLDALLGMLSDQTVLIVYIRGTVKYLYDPKFERRYVLPANNQVTLIGTTVNAAYTASSDRAIQRAN